MEDQQIELMNNLWVEKEFVDNYDDSECTVIAKNVLKKDYFEVIINIGGKFIVALWRDQAPDNLSGHYPVIGKCYQYRIKTYKRYNYTILRLINLRLINKEKKVFYSSKDVEWNLLQQRLLTKKK